MKRRFLELDVFATAPGRGNPLAVVIDAVGLDGPAMQAIAAWLKLSETTFLQPATHAAADYRVCIFTPRQELPFGGPARVGTAHAALACGLATPRNGWLVQECGAGLLPIRVEGERQPTSDVSAGQRRKRNVQSPRRPRLEHREPRLDEKAAIADIESGQDEPARRAVQRVF